MEKVLNLIITRIINANPKIIRLSIRWLQEICGVGVKNLRLRLHIYPDNNEVLCREFWSKETGIPLNQFHKSVIDKRLDKKTSKRGKLPFGTVQVSIRTFRNPKFGVNLHRLILAWIDKVLW